jgi:hypothetical protein
MGFPDLSPFPDPHCMGACSSHLYGRQHPQHESQHDHHVHHRHHLTILNARWFAPSGLPRIWRVWFGTSHVETGQGVRASHSSWYFLNAHTLPFHKGLIWFFLATIVYVPSLVSGAGWLDFKYPPLWLIVTLSSQVFIILNLNGRLALKSNLSFMELIEPNFI